MKSCTPKSWVLAACVGLSLAATSVAQPTMSPPVPTVDVSSTPPEYGPRPVIAEPRESRDRFAKMTPWPLGRTPIAPADFTVTRFAAGLKYPRWLYVLPNGDVLCAESKPGGKPKPGEENSGASHVGDKVSRVMLFKGDLDDQPGTVLIDDERTIDLPFGMALVGDRLFIAGNDEVRVFEYHLGDTKIDGRGKRILKLPKDGFHGHWTRNLVVSPDKQTLFISVGSATNVAEEGMDKEKRRANILSCDLKGNRDRIYASGLRNPVGMDFHPETQALWTVVNERDKLGDEIVPDYLAAPREGSNYGWPYVYWGNMLDPRHKGKKLPKDEISTPDYALGAHTASLGLAFCTSPTFPERYRNGAFIGQHGSWNRSSLAGYRVAFVPFTNGRPSGPPEEFLGGFIADAQAATVYGRPCGIAFAKDGSMLVADGAGQCIWRVKPAR